MERKLASIQEIVDTQPIEGADRIEVATILGWKVVVKKGEFKAGDKCVYFEVDSLLPRKPWNDFLADKNKPEAPIRLKTIRLRGQVSQGLALPIKEVVNPYPLEVEEPVGGEDLTDFLGVKKYIRPIPPNLSGKVKGSFPGFLQKTDEERIQNLPDYIESMKGKTFYITEKVDGTSGTYYDHEGEFGVCSRNLELLETEENTFWQMARELGLRDILKNKEIAVQGEIVGPGIQKNRLMLEKRKLLVFNVFDIKEYKRYNLGKFVKFCRDHGLETVPIIDTCWGFKGTMDEIITMADGESHFSKQVKREGLVFRQVDDSHISFKAISNKYLLEHGE